MFNTLVYLNKLNKSYLWALIWFLVFLTIDLSSKSIARHLLANQPPINVIPGFLDLYLIYNSGVSFGFLSHGSELWKWFILTSFTLGALGYVFWVFLKFFLDYSRFSRFAFSLLCGGAVSNAWERMYDGSVTDFFLLRLGDHVLFINNLADDFISCSLLLLVMDYYYQKKYGQGLSALTFLLSPREHTQPPR